MTSHALIQSWRKFKPDAPPYLLKGDELLLDELEKGEGHSSHRSHATWIKSPEFGVRDTRLHLGLLPMPFVGNLEAARIFILLLNPGFSEGEYFFENRSPGYRKALLKNLKQTKTSGMPFLDPRQSFNPGFRYWSRKLSGVIRSVAEEFDWTYGDTLRTVGPMIATLELVPYHSARFGISRSIVNRLQSVQLAREFVRDVLLDRAKNHGALIVLTRHAKAWGLKQRRNVIVYTPGEARGAHLTPKSRGGRAILRVLRKRVP